MQTKNQSILFSTQKLQSSKTYSFLVISVLFLETATLCFISCQIIHSKLDISVSVLKSPKFRAGDGPVSKSSYRVGDLQKLISDINWKFYLAAAGLGALSTVFFEQMAFTFDLWSYHAGMPVLSFLGTGLCTVGPTGTEVEEWETVGMLSLAVEAGFLLVYALTLNNRRNA